MQVGSGPKGFEGSMLKGSRTVTLKFDEDGVSRFRANSDSKSGPNQQ